MNCTQCLVQGHTDTVGQRNFSHLGWTAQYRPLMITNITLVHNVVIILLFIFSDYLLFFILFFNLYYYCPTCCCNTVNFLIMGVKRISCFIYHVTVLVTVCVAAVTCRWPRGKGSRHPARWGCWVFSSRHQWACHRAAPCGCPREGRPLPRRIYQGLKHPSSGYRSRSTANKNTTDTFITCKKYQSTVFKPST